MKPTISVIIPLYNKEISVEQSIRSVLNQSFRDFDLIVVDDGSTDNSLDVVRRIQDDRIVIIEQENGGPSKARNTGVKHAQGEWIVFLDADDELLPDALSVFWRLHIEHTKATIIDCSTQLRKGEDIQKLVHLKEDYSSNDFREWFFGDLMPGSGHSLFKTALIRECPYNESIRRYEDAELLFRLLPSSRRFRSNQPVFIVNTQFSAASMARKNIREDFIGHLSLKRHSFWERMCMYKFFIEERTNYPKECSQLYSSWYWRCDFFFLYKLLLKLKGLSY